MSGVKQLDRVITARQYFTLVFGCIVGVAWMVILGQLVQQAGPGGTVAALILGGLLTLPVAFCYAEMGALRPTAGGEMVYAYELYSPGACYAVGWTLALTYVATCSFEALSLAVVAETLFPGIQGKELYTLFGEQVRVGGLSIAIGGTVVMGALNVIGVRLAVGMQAIVTYVRIALIVVILCVAFAYARPENLQPLFVRSGSTGALLPILGVLIVTPALYSGFSAMATALEERAAGTSPRTIGNSLVAGLTAAVVFYCLLVLGISALLPWAAMSEMSLPAAQAFQEALGHAWVTRLVLVTALLGNLTAWNGLTIAGSRVLFALGRAQLIAPKFAHTHPGFRTPVVAIVFISIICMVTAPLGRGFVLPIVNVSSTSFAITYLVTCLATLKLRRLNPSAPRGYTVPGGRAMILVAIASSLVILVISLALPWVASGFAMPIEWVVISVWAVIGGALWLFGQRMRGAVDESERRRRLIDEAA